jgi:hypothetical protein
LLSQLNNQFLQNKKRHFLLQEILFLFLIYFSYVIFLCRTLLNMRWLWPRPLWAAAAALMVTAVAVVAQEEPEEPCAILSGRPHVILAITESEGEQMDQQTQPSELPVAGELILVRIKRPHVATPE